MIGVLMAEDLSPAALAALKADALGLSFKPPPLKKQPKGGEHTPCTRPAILQKIPSQVINHAGGAFPVNRCQKFVQPDVTEVGTQFRDG